MSTDENQVFLALQEWYQSDTYNLYQSDPQGVYYSIVLENVRSTKQPEENVLIDILEVSGGGGVRTLLVAMDRGSMKYFAVKRQFQNVVVISSPCEYNFKHKQGLNVSSVPPEDSCPPIQSRESVKHL